jgi:hypothetical protein
VFKKTIWASFLRLKGGKSMAKNIHEFKHYETERYTAEDGREARRLVLVNPGKFEEVESEITELSKAFFDKRPSSIVIDSWDTVPQEGGPATGYIDVAFSLRNEKTKETKFFMVHFVQKPRSNYLEEKLKGINELFKDVPSVMNLILITDEENTPNVFDYVCQADTRNISNVYLSAINYIKTDPYGEAFLHKESRKKIQPNRLMGGVAD